VIRVVCAVLTAAGIATTTLAAALVGAQPAAAQTPVKVLLDWAWLPYHAAFVTAQEKGYYKEAGLDVTIEQGRGSASTALLLSQGGFDIAHLNITNAAQMINKGGNLKVVGLYQHKTAAAFIGIKGKVKLDGPQSLRGIKIGSTPGGSDGLSLKIFTAANKMKLSDLNIVSLDANAKTAALFGGTIDAVSGDSPAYESYVRATNQEPVTLHLSDYGVPLLGFGFAANNGFIAKNPDAIKRFIAATKRGVAEAARDYRAACELMIAKVHLSGTLERCVDYNQGLLALSTPPADASWGHQSDEEWKKLLGTLMDTGELPGGDKPAAAYYTNDFVPK
jgi:NitT/TauT family transport system substrate-binding protein